jgi:hypothetical protein
MSVMHDGLFESHGIIVTGPPLGAESIGKGDRVL